MKAAVLAMAAAVSLAASIAFGQAVRDWHDLDAVHNQVLAAIQDMDRARAANHYDMAGHGAKAEMALKHAEQELREAIRAAKNGK